MSAGSAAFQPAVRTDTVSRNDLHAVRPQPTEVLQTLQPQGSGPLGRGCSTGTANTAPYTTHSAESLSRSDAGM